MSIPMDAAVLAILLALPLHLLVRWHFARMSDSNTMRARGIVLRTIASLDSYGEPIGRYQGQAIYQWVAFRGVRYRFDRIAAQSHQFRIRPRELYLEPGLLYLAD